MIEIKRGDIVLVNLDPVIGAEIGKARPAIVISNDLNNKYADTITIIPVTSKKVDKIYPFEVLIEKKYGLDKNSKAKTNQIRTIDKKRVIKKNRRVRHDKNKRN